MYKGNLFKGDRLSFRTSHLAGTESVHFKSMTASIVQSEELRVDNLQDSSGDAVFALTSRRLDEKASQAPISAGEGVVWVRSADSKPIFTDDTNTDTDLSATSIFDVLTKSNDADAGPMTGFNAVEMNAGIELGPDAAPASTSSSTSMAVGSGTVSSSTSNIAIGPTATNSLAQSVVVGSGTAISSAGSSTATRGLCVGSSSVTYGDNISVGYNNNAIFTNANTSPNVIITNNLVLNTFGGLQTYNGTVAVTAYSSPLFGIVGGNNNVIVGGAPGKYQCNDCVAIGGNLTHTVAGVYSEIVSVGIGSRTASQGTIVGTANVTNEASRMVVIGSDCAVNSGTTTTETVVIGTETAVYANSLNIVSIGGGQYLAAYTTDAVIIGNSKGLITYNGSNSTQIGSGKNGAASALIHPTADGETQLGAHGGYLEFTGSINGNTAAGPTVLIGVDFGLVFQYFNQAFVVEASALGRNTVNGNTSMLIFKRHLFTNRAGTLAKVTSGSTSFTAFNNPDPIAVVSTINVNTAFGNDSQGQYFLINSANNATKYYVWNDDTGLGAGDPSVTGRTGIAVDTSATANNTDIAIAIQAVLDNADFNIVRVGTALTVTNAAIGFADNIDNSLATTAPWVGIAVATPTLIYGDLVATGGNMQLRVSQPTTDTIDWKGVMRVMCGGRL